MAYTPNTLVWRYGGAIEGSSGSNFNVFEYTTTDALNVVLGTGYFSDGYQKQMRVGDIVWVVNQSTPSVVKCQVSVSTATNVASGTGPSTVIQQDVLGANLSIFPRNMLDGGDFTINPFQRGTASLGTNVGTTATYLADRWFACGGTTTYINMLQTAATDVPGFADSLTWERVASPTFTMYLGQVMETADSIRAQGQPVCLSWWAKSGAQFSSAGSALTAQIISGTGTNQSAQLLSGVGGSNWTGAATVATGTVTLTTTATRFSITGSVAANATQLGVLFSYQPSGTSTTTDNVNFYGIQLELGSAPTAFEHRDIEMELALCQRYFAAINEPTTGVFVAAGFWNSATVAQVIAYLPTQMRVAPTVTTQLGTFVVTLGSGVTETIGTLTVNSANHTPTAYSLKITTVSAATAGQGALLQGAGGTGYIWASADF
jgi:hypothetical protein